MSTNVSQEGVALFPSFKIFLSFIYLFPLHVASPQPCFTIYPIENIPSVTFMHLILFLYNEEVVDLIKKFSDVFLNQKRVNVREHMVKMTSQENL
jgi:hypothetical protein